MTGPPHVGGHPYGTPGTCQSSSDTTPNPEAKVVSNNANIIKADLVIPTSTLFSGICALGAKLHFGKVEQESRETLALWPKSSDDIFIAKRV